MKTLERHAVEMPEIVTEVELLAIEAEDTLGYSRLRQELGLPGSLGRILATLEIEPYDTDAVEKYKSELQSEERAAYVKANPASFHNASASVRWKRASLREFQKQAEVPAHVLRVAIQIKQAAPACEIHVDHFMADPFLVVTLGDEEVYYVERWGAEDKFQA